MSYLEKSIYNLCLLEHTFNFDSQAVKVVMGYNNCTRARWSAYGIGRVNSQSKCKLRLDELERPHRQKRGNVPGKDQKKNPGQVMSNTAESIRNKLKSTVNLDEKIMKDKHTMSGPEKRKM